MDELLDAIAALVSLVSPEKVQAVAARVRRTDASKAVIRPGFPRHLKAMENG
ncbi:hypothetical protein AB5N79_22745 [Xanthomonas citri pv. citri]